MWRREAECRLNGIKIWTQRTRRAAKYEENFMEVGLSGRQIVCVLFIRRNRAHSANIRPQCGLLRDQVSESIFRRKVSSDTCLTRHCEGAQRLWQSQGSGFFFQDRSPRRPRASSRSQDRDAENAEGRKVRREFYGGRPFRPTNRMCAFSSAGAEPTRRSFARGAGSYAIRCRRLFLCKK